MQKWNKAASISHSWRLKTPCGLCAQYHDTFEPLCTYCESLLIPLGAACRQCATPLPDTKILLCGHCIQHPPPLDAVFTPYRFEGPLRTLLHDFKYHEKLHLSLFFAKQMQHTPPAFNPKDTCFMPIPLHKKRIQTRGFNQSAVLARHLAKRFNQPCSLNHIKKIKNTPPQASLPAKTRQKNIRNTFDVQPVTYSHVILIDDLITTGSTANELARQLKSQGCEQVSLWCLAKTCLSLSFPF
ncbi:MAG: ComF family protein [Legionella sp.]|nr:ComF family protein [Legionella sp.]